jgi:hypothetical protein
MSDLRQIACVALIIICGCAGPILGPDGGGAAQADGRAPMGASSKPSEILPGFSNRLSALNLPIDRDVVQNVVITLPDNGYSHGAPFATGGSGTTPESPLGKLMALVAPARQAGALREETLLGDHQPEWAGHGAGAVDAAILRPPLVPEILVRFDNGHFRACATGAPGCVRFTRDELEVLAAGLYSGLPGQWMGDRCDKPLAALHPDEDGRYTGACGGLNLATFVPLALGLLRGGQRFGIHVQTRETTDVIRPRAVLGITVGRVRSVSAADAARKVSNSKRADYRWNRKARAWLELQAVLWYRPLDANDTPFYVSDDGALPLNAILELSGPPDAADTEILGAETVRSDRLNVATLLWVPRPQKDLSSALGRNPELPVGETRELLDLATAN